MIDNALKRLVDFEDRFTSELGLGFQSHILIFWSFSLISHKRAVHFSSIRMLHLSLSLLNISSASMAFIVHLIDLKVGSAHSMSAGIAGHYIIIIINNLPVFSSYCAPYVFRRK